jgi:hypothetical protein
MRWGHNRVEENKKTEYPFIMLNKLGRTVKNPLSTSKIVAPVTTFSQSLQTPGYGSFISLGE